MRRPLSVWVALLLLPGCYAQGAALAGAAIHESSTTAVSWGAQLSAVLLPSHFGAGVELEGDAEHHRGSAFSVGGQLVAATGSDASQMRVGGHLDLGLPLGWSQAPRGYLGATVEIPVRLERSLPISERNRNYRVLGSSPWLVPFARYRFYGMARGREGTHDVAAGIALRMHYESDWF
jgi:hypothetical protein